MDQFKVFKELSSFDRFKYFDEPHSYYCGETKLVSVTTLLHRFVKEFDTEKEAAKFVDSPNNVDCLRYDQILKLWKYKNSHGKFEGNVLHDFAEGYISNKIFARPESSVFEGLAFSEIKDTYDVLEKHFVSFYKDHVAAGRLMPIRSEVVLGDLELGLAGMSDQIFYDNQLEGLVIYDWKTSTAIGSESKFQNKMLYCLSHLDECELNTYSLQLGLYKRLIERNTCLRIKACVIVWFNEKNDDYKLIKCKDVEAEIDSIIEFKKVLPEMFLPHKKVRRDIDLGTYDFFSF